MICLAIVAAFLARWHHPNLRACCDTADQTYFRAIAIHITRVATYSTLAVNTSIARLANRRDVLCFPASCAETSIAAACRSHAHSILLVNLVFEACIWMSRGKGRYQHHLIAPFLARKNS
jgi:hypothetical protein